MNSEIFHNSTSCIFCEIPAERVLMQNDFAYLIKDGFPVTPGHTLIIPKRHAVDYFDLTQDELLACDELIRLARSELISADSEVAGFNVGVNAGAAAGQTIFHCHIHLIPRRYGDVESPRGGVRHVIPGKDHY